MLLMVAAMKLLQPVSSKGDKPSGIIRTVFTELRFAWKCSDVWLSFIIPPLGLLCGHTCWCAT